jgi:hypothetical protein
VLREQGERVAARLPLKRGVQLAGRDEGEPAVRRLDEQQLAIA